MIKHGVAPYLECSSEGEKRLSAFHARLKSEGGRSIEEIYQAAKVFDDGQGGEISGLLWRQAKGKRALNMAAVAKLYSALWDRYIGENPELLDLIVKASGLADQFGQPGHQCQATELWRIRCQAMQGKILQDKALQGKASPVAAQEQAETKPDLAALPRRVRQML